MRKSDKKLDNQLRKSLTNLCENVLEKIQGFQWLTHTVNYPNIKQSLKVVCVFDTNEHLALFLSSGDKIMVESQIIKALSALNITLAKVDKQLVFDSEENCEQFANGNWTKRLQ